MVCRLIVILSLILAGCTTVLPTENSETATSQANDPSLTSTLSPTATATPTLTPTLTPSPPPTSTFTPTVTPTLIGGVPGKYISLTGGNRNIVTLWNANGTRIKDLWESPENIQPEIAWAPNGSRFTACVCDWNKNPVQCDIYIIGVDDASANKLPFKIWPGLAWSPDSKTIAFTAITPAERYGLYVIKADGTDRQQLKTYQYQNSYPIFSPNGKKIAWRSDAGAIRVMNLDGSENNIAAYGWWNEFKFSPDGKRLTFSTVNGAFRSDIFLVNIDGSQRVQLSNDNKYDDRSPEFSPDGKYVLYRGSGQVFVASADGSKPPVMLGFGSTYYPRWSPDGKYVFFKGYLGEKTGLYTKLEEACYAIRPDQSEILKLATKYSNACEVNWQPGSNLEVGEVQSAAATLTPTPTPWSLLVDVPLFDDFSRPSFDQSKWRKTTWDTPETYKNNSWQIIQNAGYLSLQGSTPNWATSGLDLELVGQSRKSKVGLVGLEAKIDLLQAGGRYTDAHVRINAQVNGKLWWTQCRLSADAQGDQPKILCEVLTYNGGPRTEYQTQPVNINFGQWYRVRIELSRDGMIQYFLDGKLIDSFTPKDANLVSSVELTPIIGVNAGGGSIQVLFDDVRTK